MKIGLSAVLRAGAAAALWLGAGAAVANCLPLAGNPQVAPDSRYTDNGNGTVTDGATGLMWAKCSQGQSGTACSGSATSMTWSAALVAADAATLAGHTNWRLPNVEELQSLVETGCFNPGINPTIFPATPGVSFWSSTTYAPDASVAWIVYFSSGLLGADGKSNGHPVRLVRRGQGFDTFSSAADFTPQVFTFTDQTGVAPNSLIESGSISVVGLTTVTGIKVTGGEYSLNGAAYTSVPGVARNGDTVRVRHTSGSDFSVSVDTDLTVGGVIDTFTSTTLSLADDTIFRNGFEAP